MQIAMARHDSVLSSYMYLHLLQLQDYCSIKGDSRRHIVTTKFRRQTFINYQFTKILGLAVKLYGFRVYTYPCSTLPGYTVLMVLLVPECSIFMLLRVTFDIFHKVNITWHVSNGRPLPFYSP